MADVDQREIDNQSPWLLAAAAAALLGVKRQTLYAYVSRGLVRRVCGPDGVRRYAREDLLRLRARHDARAGHGPAAAGALRWGEPVLASAITAIGPEGPRYRGQSALTLAQRGTPFEAVAELLWTDTLPSTRPRFAAAPLPAGKLRPLLPRTPSPFFILQLGVSHLRARDPAPWLGALDGELARARTLCRTLADALALSESAAIQAAVRAAPSVAEAVALALGGRCDRRSLGALEQALVLSADHELNASSFTARIAASAGADLYTCVGAALGTLSGPRHGGACDRVEALLQDCGTPARARTLVKVRASRGEELPGFGHRLYPGGDPRARRLLTVARELGRGRRTLHLIEALTEAYGAMGGEPPALDLGLVAVAAATGLRAGGASALFALGRIAGFVAHVLEQRQEPALLRPRARYVGR